MCWSLFNKVAYIYWYNFIQKRLQLRCFPVKFAIIFGTPILKNICERLLLLSVIIMEEKFLEIPQAVAKIVFQEL